MDRRESAYKKLPSTRINQMLDYILAVTEAQAAVYKQARALTADMRSAYMARGIALCGLAG